MSVDAGLAAKTGPAAVDPAVGQKATSNRRIAADDISLYAALSGDCNPVHLAEEYASGTRFGRRIAHGMLVASLISATIANRNGGSPRLLPACSRSWPRARSGSSAALRRDSPARRGHRGTPSCSRRREDSDRRRHRRRHRAGSCARGLGGDRQRGSHPVRLGSDPALPRPTRSRAASPSQRHR